MTKKIKIFCNGLIKSISDNSLEGFGEKIFDFKELVAGFNIESSTRESGTPWPDESWSSTDLVVKESGEVVLTLAQGDGMSPAVQRASKKWANVESFLSELTLRQEIDVEV